MSLSPQAHAIVPNKSNPRTIDSLRIRSTSSGLIYHNGHGFRLHAIWRRSPVPKDEAAQIVDILEKARAVVSAHYYPNEGHGFAKWENQVDAIRRTIEWFDFMPDRLPSQVCNSNVFHVIATAQRIRLSFPSLRPTKKLQKCRHNITT